MKTFISIGAGVNSTAILALIKLGRLQFENPIAVFADTGGEKPETYEYLQYLQTVSPIPIQITTGKEGSLWEYCKDRKILPMRHLRWCSDGVCTYKLYSTDDLAKLTLTDSDVRSGFLKQQVDKPLTVDPLVFNYGNETKANQSIERGWEGSYYVYYYKQFGGGGMPSIISNEVYAYVQVFNSSDGIACEMNDQIKMAEYLVKNYPFASVDLNTRFGDGSLILHLNETSTQAAGYQVFFYRKNILVYLKVDGWNDTFNFDEVKRYADIIENKIDHVCEDCTSAPIIGLPCANISKINQTLPNPNTPIEVNTSGRKTA